MVDVEQKEMIVFSELTNQRAHHGAVLKRKTHSGVLALNELRRRPPLLLTEPTQVDHRKRRLGRRIDQLTGRLSNHRVAGA